MTSRLTVSDHLAVDADDPTSTAALLARRFRRAYVAHALAGLLPRRRRRPLKRALDVLVALPLLIVGAPLTLAIAASVWVRSHERAVIAQVCAGHDAKVILLRQFRPTTATERAADGEAVGAWLSESRLARWPALWSVLTGTLSLVGPQPWTLDALSTRQTGELARLYAAPGLLRLRPVGRLRRLARTQAEADLRYITAGSLWVDIEQISAALFMPARRFP